MLQSWCTYNFKQDAEDMEVSDFIWFNSLIRVDKAPFLWVKLYKKGLKYVHQLIDNTGNIIQHDTGLQSFGLSVMQLNSLITAIPSTLLKRARDGDVNEADKTVKNLLCVKRLSQKVYQDLTIEETLMDKKATVWQKLLEENIDYSIIRKAFSCVYCAMNIPKLLSFQFRLVHNAIVTNIHLYKWKVKCENVCSFCKKHPEDIIHLFCKCPIIVNLWEKVKEHCQRAWNFQLDISHPKHILLFQSKFKLNHLSNFICVCTKQYIYRKRCARENINFRELKNVILSYENTEKYIATKNNLLNKHRLKWG